MAVVKRDVVEDPKVGEMTQSELDEFLDEIGTEIGIELVRDTWCQTEFNGTRDDISSLAWDLVEPRDELWAHGFRIEND